MAYSNQVDMEVGCFALALVHGRSSSLKGSSGVRHTNGWWQRVISILTSLVPAFSHAEKPRNARGHEVSDGYLHGIPKSARFMLLELLLYEQPGASAASSW
jgi:hypothetical protein